MIEQYSSLTGRIDDRLVTLAWKAAHIANEAYGVDLVKHEIASNMAVPLMLIENSPFALDVVVNDKAKQLVPSPAFSHGLWLAIAQETTSFFDNYKAMLVNPDKTEAAQASFDDKTEKLRRVMGTLTLREEAIFVARMGLTTGLPLTYRAVGEQHNLSATRIQQIFRQTSSKIRHHSRAEILIGNERLQELRDQYL